MRLVVLGSSSAGNGYVLDNGNEALLIECGVPLARAYEAVDYSDKIVGCLVSHEHHDHAGYFDEYANAGIPLYASAGTLRSVKSNSPNAHVFLPEKTTHIGSFSIYSFHIEHDATEPMGFIIKHPVSGAILFITDARDIPYHFKGLSTMLIECNYSEKILADNASIPSVVASRLNRTHLSLERLCEALKDTEIDHINHIVLLHLSAQNSNADLFRKTIQDLTDRDVVIADKGLILDINDLPF